MLKEYYIFHVILFLNTEPLFNTMFLQIIDDERCEKLCIKIPNVSHNSVINSKIATTLLKALKR